MFKDKLVFNFKKDYSGLSFEYVKGSANVKFNLAKFNSAIHACVDCFVLKSCDGDRRSESLNLTVSECNCDNLQSLAKRCFSSAQVATKSDELLELLYASEGYVLEQLVGE